MKEILEIGRKMIIKEHSFYRTLQKLIQLRKAWINNLIFKNNSGFLSLSILSYLKRNF